MNPYESPSGPPGLRRNSESPEPPRLGHACFLAIVILLGLVSLAPWLAIIFLVCSTPVFVRLATRYPPAPNSFSRRILSAMGGAGMVLATVAAIGGTFFGTCTITAWGAMFSEAGIALEKSIHDSETYGVVGSIALGTVAGLAASVVAGIWLTRLCFRRVRVSPSGELPSQTNHPSS